ncbi:MAG: peptide-binding protein [Planctomycetaceae bacterium]
MVVCSRSSFSALRSLGLLQILLGLLLLGSPTSAMGQEKKAGPAKFMLGDLVPAFTPPKLEELEKTAEWVDRPVVDSLEVMRKKLAAEKVTVTPAEALKTKNNTPKDNAKILTGLGRLPESDKECDFNATINRHSAGDVNSLNPVLSSSVVESDLSGLTGFGLFSFDGNFVPFASKDAVVTWQTSKDGLYDKVVMRKDNFWSDGKPITAHDVVFSFKLIMTNAVPVPAQRSGTDKIKWIEAYDDYTLVVFHKESLATNTWNLNFSIVPKHIYEKTAPSDPTLSASKEHVALENKPVVGGAYEVTSRLRGQEIVLERREAYYMVGGKQVRDKPYFKTVRFRIRPDVGTALLAVKAGDIDEMILNPDQWRNQTSDDLFYKNNTKAYGLEWTEFHFVWNCSKERKFFDDKRVRMAMSYAFDHEEMLTKLRFGLDEPCTGLFHHSSRWAPKPSPKPFKQDFDKAEELLAAAGWTDSDDDGILDKKINGKKTDFEFTILVTNRQERIDVCKLLAESLEKVGIKCNVLPLEFTVVVDRLFQHNFDAAFGGWGSGADPYTTENIFKTGEERNYGQYSNPEVDKLFEQGLKEFDESKRAAIYAKIHSLLYADQPYTWLYYQNGYYAFNKSLRGYAFSPRGPYHYAPGIGSIWKAVP